MTDTVCMLVEKTQHSMFMPDLVLSTLLPEHFPPYTKSLQLESLKWIVTSTRRFFKNSRCFGCIVNTDNQFLHQREIDDSKHVTLWACSVLQRGISQTTTSESVFYDLAVPMLRNVAFRGRDGDLALFLQSLRDEFERGVTALHINDKLFKHEVVTAINTFETYKLARIVRCASARVLGQNAVLFGGMVYTGAFSLAFLRILWMDRKAQILTRIGALPTFRGTVPSVHYERVFASR